MQHKYGDIENSLRRGLLRRMQCIAHMLDLLYELFVGSMPQMSGGPNHWGGDAVGIVARMSFDYTNCAHYLMQNTHKHL